eukprot:XP_011663632.1 PREDICTED: uncharacterized protein LOC105438025 [Strongylocentrotus purpuratus]
MCGMLEHAKDAHTIREAGEHETEQKNRIEKLASKADAKIRNVDKYFTLVKDQRKRLHNVQEQLNCELDATFEEIVEKLKERKRVLKNEIEQKIGKLRISLGDVEKPIRKQIDEIRKVLVMVKNGLTFPLQTEALTSHNAMCQQLEGLLNQIRPDGGLPRRTAEEGEKIGFRSQGSDGLQLGQLRQKEYKWVLCTEAPLPAGKTMSGMVISPNNEMAVGCYEGGIVTYSPEGIIQDTVLISVKVSALHVMPDGGYVIRDNNNRISLYTEHCEKLDVSFETMDATKGIYGGLTVNNVGLIFIGYKECCQTQVFKPEGGKAIREITTCNGFVPNEMFALTSNQTIVVSTSTSNFHFPSQVEVINDVSGAIIHSIRKGRVLELSMMATLLKHEAFHKNLECPVCLSFFKEPKILTCSHTFCKGFLETLLESRGRLMCPTCREETPVHGGDVGRLQTNITVRSLVEDVETQGQVGSNSNQENESLQRKWNKCRKHPNYDEVLFCFNCNKYVCSLCGLLEHAKDAHTILEAGEHETEEKNHVEKLVSKADAKIRNVDKYFILFEDQRKRVHNIQERLNGEINATFEELVEKLKARKTVLKKEVGHKLGKIKTSLGDVEKSIRKQIDEIKKVLELVKDGLNFPLQTEGLTAHKAMCQQLEELLNQIGPDEELPRRTAEEGERIDFRSQGSEELKLGQLRQKKSKWVLRTEARLPAGKSMIGISYILLRASYKIPF